MRRGIQYRLEYRRKGGEGKALAPGETGSGNRERTTSGHCQELMGLKKKEKQK